ncbi:3-hydroxyacyl-CoA dehydrogenase family protein [Anaerobiospirillum thomasii]|uniref:3-hydroxybutyryl-CoA dehydrogenase n=1 Tax=Anaerobiospirillum thomasii TaxID=179995 RepID=A0A2X0WU94_9GAMM|nr:3-hydroxyacyl-CoA dehydrogenase NAD-binding domain-containing protein [Anaerobiospirillum thomasii]SPT69031.1 3-hydroxybutyryl-CoA dehydrogenase [Anaerobiospirillum thomasii]
MTIAVIGAGLMGSGIALTCALANYDVINIDNSEKSLENAKDTLNALLNKKVAKGKMHNDEKLELLRKIDFSSDFSKIKDASIIIEAVPENIDIKKSVFITIDEMSSRDSILISNTSGLSISEIASVTKRPDQVIGAHFFYPAPVMKLVELVRGLVTSDETYTRAKDFIVSLGKETVDAPELPGFIVNRILVPMQNEAAFMVMEGCKPEDVDKAMKLGTNMPMGPLELTDFVGIDVMLATMKGLYNGFRDSKYRPCPILETMVKAGHLGRKSGKGFYNYN